MPEMKDLTTMTYAERSAYIMEVIMFANEVREVSVESAARSLAAFAAAIDEANAALSKFQPISLAS